MPAAVMKLSVELAAASPRSPLEFSSSSSVTAGPLANDSSGRHTAEHFSLLEIIFADGASAAGGRFIDGKVHPQGSSSFLASFVFVFCLLSLIGGSE